MVTIVCRPVKNSEELMQSFSLRRKVFVEEQGLFKRTDKDRYDKRAIHIVALLNDMIIGTVRIYHKGSGLWYGGRLAVHKKYRGRVGKALIQTAVEVAKRNNAQHFRAMIQLENVPLFKRLKWKAAGPAISYRGRPHLEMEAALD